MKKEARVKHRIYTLIILFLLGIMILYAFMNLPEQNLLPERTAGQMVSEGVKDTGSINLITAILYGYRAFDSLIESTVIFATVSAIVLLLSFKTLPVSSNGLSFIVKRTFGILTPLIFLFALYIITHGHLSPGGGFQGGVIIGSISIIFSIIYGSAFDYNKFSPTFKTVIETGGALLFMLVGSLGLITSGFFLDNINILRGSPGMLFSSGSIPIISVGVGFKVGAGLAIIFYSMIKKTYVEET